MEQAAAESIFWQKTMIIKVWQSFLAGISLSFVFLRAWKCGAEHLQLHRAAREV